MISLAKQLYLPHLQDPEILHMGLQTILPEQWLQPDLEASDFYQNKIIQFNRNPDTVYQAEAESVKAQAEFGALLLDYLLRQHGDIYQRDENHLYAPALGLQWQLNDIESLWQSSLWIADDICILLPDSDDYRLCAASLCSPSHWYLAEKFGQTLAAIHKPIPGFEQTLTPAVSRFFSHLRVEHPVQRFNWSVQPSDSLSWLGDGDEPLSADAALFWRVERQTLRRLPQTGAVAFTIKVYVHPLEELRQLPAAMSALLNAIDRCSDDMQDYKDFPRMASALQKYRIR
jgi:hypothetical protein